jgi:predicted nucleotidyltransferase
MKRPSLDLPKEQITAFCRAWKVREFSVFGSALRDDYGPDGDIDVLVAFLPDAQWSLLDHAQMQLELEAILGRKVDLVSRRSVKHSYNPIRRQAILDSAESVYVAR